MKIVSIRSAVAQRSSPRREHRLWSIKVNAVPMDSCWIFGQGPHCLRSTVSANRLMALLSFAAEAACRSALSRSDLVLWPISAEGAPGGMSAAGESGHGKRQFPIPSPSSPTPLSHCRRSVVSFAVGVEAPRGRASDAFLGLPPGQDETIGSWRPRTRGGPKLPWEGRLLDHLVGAQQDRLRYR
jgi:hypothetical protein